jgi:nuclear pore complex protein Nup188
LSGKGEGQTQEQLVQLVLLRADRLTNVSTPFGSPSDASRRQVESGSVTLPDGFEVTLDKDNQEWILAISDHFQIDEIQAVILLRSFLYNEGLPPYPGPNEGVTLMGELVEAITPFYFSERLSLLRVLIPLFRANMHAADPVRDVAEKVLPELFPDGSAFTESLISEYVRKTQQKLPANVSTDPRKASRWAKQNSKEQLVLLEVLFWCMWGLVSCHGALVVRIFEVGYDVQLGSKQENSTLLLDEEGLQLQQDCAAIWMLIMLEILELEQIGVGITIPPTTDPDEQEVYYASPESLKRIHELVLSHGGAQYACIYAAWTFVLLRLVQGAADLKSIPDDYALFFSLLSNHNTYSKDREPLHRTMARICFQPDVGLFKLIHTLLTNSPVFVTTIAWKAGSTVTDPNAVAFRSVMKGSRF